jgi:hypothetical protein
MAANPLPWPEIKQHVQRATDILRGHMAKYALAATVIQRHFRASKGQGAPPHPLGLPRMEGRFPRAAVERFFTAPLATASTKLDGTNVGIDSSSGGLVGRRRCIAEAAGSYQKCPLHGLRGRGGQVKALQAALAERYCPCLSECEQFFLYGELFASTTSTSAKKMETSSRGVHLGWRPAQLVVDASWPRP